MKHLEIVLIDRSKSRRRTFSGSILNGFEGFCQKVGLQ